MNTPSPSNREPSYKILRLIGAITIGVLGMQLLNALLGSEEPAGTRPDAQSHSMELPASMPPAGRIEG